MTLNSQAAEHSGDRPLMGTGHCWLKQQAAELQPLSPPCRALELLKVDKTLHGVLQMPSCSDLHFLSCFQQRLSSAFCS